ncbi:SDR family NAD(P)-dependent oxidoreductase [Pyxidicoccus sp. 3LG]
MLLEDKVVLITGMTRGIGRAIAERFAAHGARVAGVYNSSDAKAREVAQALEEQGRFLGLYKGDVADGAFATATVDDLVAKWGRIDVLVNNAGITRDGFAMRLSDAQWGEVLDTNFGGTFHFTQAALPHFLARGQGNVINIVSVTGVMGREAQVNYGTAKGAIIGLTRLLARQYSPRGLRFNLIAPGLIDTDMLAQVPEDKIDNFIKHTAMQRVGTTTEVANVAVFLASELASYLSTTSVRVDGGFLR